MIKKEQIPILIINALAIVFFTTLFVLRENYEFMIYIGVIIFFLTLILFTNKKINYPNPVLWGLTLWSMLHMSGGSLFIGGTRLYEIILFPLVGEPYHIFKYDQFVHIVGFGVATLVAYHLVSFSLDRANIRWISLSIVVVMAGLGLGALNEIIEFAITVAVPETGVGGYENTSLDLVADLIGAIGGLIVIKITNK